MPWGEDAHATGGGAAASGWGATHTPAVKFDLQCSICQNLLAFPACTQPIVRRLVPARGRYHVDAPKRCPKLGTQS